ncbi:laforin-like [Corvus cornix cornix]|uniref:laforin-like n=1 Tax=Corvus cornix cornix TaxID=932674 RepID=UPI001951E695|nr:laforin-like [Corvus cornix cornix]
MGGQWGRGSSRAAAAGQGGAAGSRRPERGGEGGQGGSRRGGVSGRRAAAQQRRGGGAGGRARGAAIGWSGAGGGARGRGARRGPGRGRARSWRRRRRERRRAPPPPRHPPGAGEPLTNAHCALGDSTVRVTAANLLLGHHCAAVSPPRTRASKPRRPSCPVGHPGEGLRRANPIHRHCPASSGSPSSALRSPDALPGVPQDRPHLRRGARKDRTLPAAGLGVCGGSGDGGNGPCRHPCVWDCAGWRLNPRRCCWQEQLCRSSGKTCPSSHEQHYGMNASDFLLPMEPSCSASVSKRKGLK